MQSFFIVKAWSLSMHGRSTRPNPPHVAHSEEAGSGIRTEVGLATPQVHFADVEIAGGELLEGDGHGLES